jgi:RND family efflux transporter MFP subunit
MTHISPTKPQPLDQGLQGAPAAPPRRALGRAAALAGVAAVIGLGLVWFAQQPQAMPQAAPPPPRVTVSRPLQQTVAVSTSFLGQFSAADTVELRAQVGGILTSIDFTDGQIVHKGDLLFTIDPRPYQVRLQQAVAQLQTSLSHRTLTGVELWRARELKRADYGTAESVDQRAADEASAQASISSARAAVEDAELDLEYARITAPFTGRIGAHLVSVGNLVSGSRGGVSPTTLLARLVSLDPIYLDFDMSEADYIAFQKAHPGAETADVVISLDGDGSFSRHGRLDFVDNSVNRDTGTIHVRATVPNKDLVLTPGEFARLRLPIGAPANVLLLPAAAIVPDQSQNIAMVVSDNGKVAPRIVQLGELYRGLRIVKSGLDPNDRVIIDGLMLARPGSTVSTMDGKIVPQGS